MKDLASRQKVDIFVLQETKLQNFNRKMSRDLWGRKHFKYIHKNAAKRAGGILVAWNLRTINITESRVGDHSISIKCKNTLDNFY